MRKIFGILLILISPLFLAVFANAQIPQEAVELPEKVAPDLYPLPYQDKTFFGQMHTYSVIFRGNGETVVNARIAVGNSSDKKLEEIKLRIPDIEAGNILVYQMFKQKVCVHYEQGVYDPVTRRYPPSVCTEYSEPDYYNSSYYNSKYKKAVYDYTNDTLTVKLAEPLLQGKSGAFFVYFRAKGYTKKDVFGAYSYTFKTFQAEESVQSVNIGMSTDSDLYMKGATGSVDYRFEDVSAETAKLAPSAGGEYGAVSSALDSYVTSIGRGSVSKSASNLSPLESYEVKGSYAPSRAKLYGKEIMIGIGVVLGMLAILAVFTIIIVKLLKKSTPVKTSEQGDVVKENLQNSSGHPAGKMFAVVALLGFMVSVAIVFYTVVVFLIGALASSNVNYSMRGIVIVALILISILIYIVLIFSPAILLGVKRGAGWGIGCVVSTVLWLIFWIVIVFIAFFLFGKSNINGIIPLIFPVVY